jgi:hypothetical protein
MLYTKSVCKKEGIGRVVPKYADSFTGKPSIPFLGIYANGRISPDPDSLNEHVCEILANINFCPFCGKEVRFADQDSIKFYQGDDKT